MSFGHSCPDGVFTNRVLALRKATKGNDSANKGVVDPDIGQDRSICPEQQATRYRADTTKQENRALALAESGPGNAKH